MSLPTKDDLQAAWDEVKEIHKEYLASHKVKIAEAEEYTEKAKALWLAVLYYFKDREVHKDEISKIAQRDIKGIGADQQVRHLKRDGWNIGDKPGLHRLDPYQPSPEFSNQKARKRGRLNAKNFAELKESFGSRCATCGAHEGRPDPRYGKQKVKLQQGHQNPKLPGDDRSNIIPQCQFCNRSYRDDYVFDEKGRVHAVASIRPVKRADKDVQKKILKWLTENIGKENQ